MQLVQEKELQHHGIGLMLIKPFPLTHSEMLCRIDWFGEGCASLSPLKISILMSLCEVETLLLLVSWALCFNITCMDMTF